MILIEKARPENAKEIAPLFNAYRQFYEKESDLPGAELFLYERLKATESVIYFAKNTELRAVGFVQLYPLFSSTRMKRLWLLNDLFVSPEFRGRGISHQLIAACKQLCIESNACGMMLETAKSNFIGNNLYPTAGFELDTAHNYYSWDTP